MVSGVIKSNGSKMTIAVCVALSLTLYSSDSPNLCGQYTRYFDGRDRLGSAIPAFRVASTADIVKTLDRLVSSAKAVPQRNSQQDLATAHAKAQAGLEILNRKLSLKNKDKRIEELKAQYMKENPTEGFLVIGSEIVGESLNGSVVPIVVETKVINDQRMTAGEQILARLREIARGHKGTLENGLEEFHRSVTGGVGRVTYATDRLTDGVDVIAILKSAELKRRLLVSPELIDMLISSSRMSDRLLNQGGIDKEMRTSQEKEALLLAKAMVFTHQQLLNSAGNKIDNRISTIIEPDRRNALLRESVLSSELLLLEATSEGFSHENTGKIGRLAKQFDENH